MKLRKLVKQNGKRCLYNNWGKAIAIVLLMLAVSLLFTIVELIIGMVFGTPQMVDVGNDGYWLNNLPNTSLLSIVLTAIIAVGAFLVTAPLKLGITRWYYELSEGDSPEILSIFNCFSSRQYFRALSLQTHILGRMILWALLYFALPIVVLGASLWVLDYGPYYMNLDMCYVIGSMGLMFTVLLTVFFGFFYAVAIQKFFLARYYVTNENLGVWEALKKSRHATKGKRGEILLFRLSFLPWFLSCALVLPCLYVQPYYEISAMLFARVMIEEHYRSTQLVPVESESDLDSTQVFEVPLKEE